MKKILKIILAIFLFIFVLIGEIALVPPLKKESKTLGYYQNVIGDNVSLDTKITDIAMLGAHDSFSNGINYKSGSNVNEDGIHNNKIVNTVAKGFVIKLSKAQVSSAKQMLYKGVRYFDVRITKIDNKYYGCHGLLSYELDYYVKDIVDFLSDHPKEFVIFDIQHFYTSEGNNFDAPIEEYNKLFTYLDNLGLMDYINYENVPSKPSLLTYKDVTNNATKGGVVMLAKTSSNTKVFSRDSDANKDLSSPTSIRSYWHNTNSIDELKNGINEEYEFIKNNSDLFIDYFRINQAQMTGFIADTKSICRTILKGSLLGLANSSNTQLIKDENLFKKYLEYMPIFMVDYATTNKNNFNEVVNNYIGEFNKSLNS